MADPIRDFLLDASGDLAVVNGDFATVSGAAAVEQGIAVRLKTFLGEIWLDESVGTPWVQQIMGVKNPDPVVVRELLAEQIASVPDVTQVVGADLQIDNVTRQATITYTVRTIYSTTPISGEVTGP